MFVFCRNNGMMFNILNGERVSVFVRRGRDTVSKGLECERETIVNGTKGYG